MPRMHAITLLATGGMAGTIVGYLIARFGPQFKPAPLNPNSNPKPKTDAESPRNSWFKSFFRRSDKAPETASATTGNLAFDAYRSEALERLEKEQADFSDFMNKLQMAKDQEEFDAFLVEKKKQGRRKGW